MDRVWMLVLGILLGVAGFAAIAYNFTVSMVACAAGAVLLILYFRKEPNDK